MLKNAYLLAKIGADTAENKRHFAKKNALARRCAPRFGPAFAIPGKPKNHFGVGR